MKRIVQWWQQAFHRFSLHLLQPSPLQVSCQQRAIVARLLQWTQHFQFPLQSQILLQPIEQQMIAIQMNQLLILNHRHRRIVLQKEARRCPQSVIQQWIMQQKHLLYPQLDPPRILRLNQCPLSQHKTWPTKLWHRIQLLVLDIDISLLKPIALSLLSMYFDRMKSLQKSLNALYSSYAITV